MSPKHNIPTFEGPFDNSEKVRLPLKYLYLFFERFYTSGPFALHRNGQHINCLYRVSDALVLHSSTGSVIAEASDLCDCHHYPILKHDPEICLHDRTSIFRERLKIQGHAPHLRADKRFSNILLTFVLCNPNTSQLRIRAVNRAPLAFLSGLTI